MTLSYLEIADDELDRRCGAAPRTATSPTCSRRTDDRMTVGALVPMTRPEDGGRRARVRGARARLQDRGVRRARPPADRRPGGIAYRLDTFGVDSAYDYDPLWAKCVELGVAPVFHSSLQSHRVTRSATSYVYNHIGGLAANHESLCKSLFLSGVTHRFPDAARSGSSKAAWRGRAALFSDLVGHWEKRNARRRSAALDPDRARRRRARWRCSTATATSACARARRRSARTSPRPAARPEQLDEFAAAGLRVGRRPPRPVRAELLLRLRGRRPARRVGVRRARQSRRARGCARSSARDISHWDVPDMTEPVEEAYELVEDGMIGERRVRGAACSEPGAAARRDESGVLRGHHRRVSRAVRAVNALIDRVPQVQRLDAGTRLTPAQPDVEFDWRHDEIDERAVTDHSDRQLTADRVSQHHALQRLRARNGLAAGCQ